MGLEWDHQAACVRTAAICQPAWACGLELLDVKIECDEGRLWCLRFPLLKTGTNHDGTFYVFKT
jgi:hypothetical protein